METKLPYTKNTTKIKAQRSLVAGLVIGSLAISSLIFLGMKIEQSRYEQPLPANQACLDAIDASSKVLAGEKIDVAPLVQRCRENVSKYEIVEAQK